MFSQYQRGYGRRKPPPSAQIDWTHPLARALKACWLFNEGGGVTVRDIASGGKYNGTIGDLTLIKLAPAQFGIGLSSAATTGNTAVTFTALPSTTTFTMEVWLKNVSSDNYGAVLLAIGTGNGLYLHSSKMTYFFGGDHLSTTAMTLGKWYHCVVSVTAGAGQFYLNAVPDGTFAGALTESLSVMCNDAGSETFVGTFDLMRVWVGRALSASDVAQLYNEPFAMFQQPVRRTYFVLRTGIPRQFMHAARQRSV